MKKPAKQARRKKPISQVRHTKKPKQTINIRNYLTAETVAVFDALHAKESASGKKLLKQYRQERKDILKQFPDLAIWLKEIENFSLEGATNAALLKTLNDQGFITFSIDNKHSNKAALNIQLISPKILDARVDSEGKNITFAMTTVQALFRKAPCPKHIQPAGWRDCCLVDCELFELPDKYTGDVFGDKDDREKIHIVYIRGVDDEGQRQLKVCYLAFGTGEQYGTGPRHRETTGRYRFYRFDEKDNFQCEYIEETLGAEKTKRGLKALPQDTLPTEDCAEMLLFKGAADHTFGSISDSFFAETAQVWLRKNPHNKVILCKQTLRKKHINLRSIAKSAWPFALDDPTEAMRRAWKSYRYFHVAWMHPLKLIAKDSIELYYKQLPAYKQKEYETYRLKPELFRGVKVTGKTLSIPEIIIDPVLRDHLNANHPAVLQLIETWLADQLSRDLYAFGNHPEFRLYYAMIVLRLLKRSGVWNRCLNAIAEERAFELRLTWTDLLQGP